MGSECQVGSNPKLKVRAIGTAPMEWIEIVRDVDVVHRRELRPRPEDNARRLRVSWSGARIRGRGRHSRWDGSLRLDGGLIRKVSPWGFETPGQGIVYSDEHEVRWRSTTAGDPDGVELELDADPDAVLSIQTGPASFAVSISEIESVPYIFPAGGLEQRVEVSWVSATPGPIKVEFEWEDEAVQPGTHAYWVRLLQADTHAAWSSPIYATVSPS